MKAIDVIRDAMAMSGEGTVRLVSDMRDAAMTRATPGGKGGDGNHVIWLLGHLCWIEGNLRAIVLGENNPVGHWKTLFESGSVSRDDARVYPSFDELLAKFQELRAANVRLLETIGDAGLDRAPQAVPPGFESAMKTVAQTYMLVALHNMVHYGQIADARRVAGRKPLF